MRQINGRPAASTIRKVFPSDREVLLARLLLHVCDLLGAEDKDQQFLELYNGCKAIAEPTVRAHGEAV